MSEVEGLRDNVMALLKERNELLVVNAALKNMAASLRIKQQPPGSPKLPPSCEQCPLVNICHVSPGYGNTLCLDVWRQLRMLRR